MGETTAHITLTGQDEAEVKFKVSNFLSRILSNDIISKNYVCEEFVFKRFRPYRIHWCFKLLLRKLGHTFSRYHFDCLSAASFSCHWFIVAICDLALGFIMLDRMTWSTYPNGDIAHDLD